MTSKPLQTIEDFLIAMGWWAVEPKPPQTLLAGTELPRQGRQEELRKIWQSIRQFFNSPAGRRALYYLHASPGVGKTYLLREVLKRLEQDIPEALREFAQDVAFAVVNFNSSMKPPEGYPARAPWNEHIRLLLPLTLRLVYSNCCKPDITWPRFLSEVFDANINPRSLELEPVLSLLRRSSGKTKLVLLVDELMNADLVQRGLAETVRHALCRAQDTFCDDDFSFMALFSTLDEQLMLQERRLPGSTGPMLVTAATGRPVMAATGLPLFDREQTAALLSASLPDGYRTYREHAISKEAVIRFLTALTGGHGRCIEFVLRTVGDHQASSLHPVTLDWLIADAVKLCGSVYAQMRLPVLKLVLLGKPVKKTFALPDAYGTINDLVANGELIDSFPDPNNVQMTPAVPPMFLHVWLAANKENAEVTDLHRHLRRLVDLVWKFEPQDFECFHARWEALIRHCRRSADAGHYRDISLFELYGRPRHSGRHGPSALLNSRVDASVLLHICGDEIDWGKITAERLQRMCWLPPNPQNAGFDALLPYPTHDEEREIILVFIENRHSRADATTKLTLKEVRSKHKHCKEFAQKHFNTCDFVLLFVCLREANGNAISEAPANCAFLLREELTHLYGPTLMRVAESLDGGLGRVAVEGSMENAATLAPLVTSTSASASTFSTSTSSVSTDLHGVGSAYRDDKSAPSARRRPGDAVQSFAARRSKRSQCDDAQQQKFDQAEDEESSFVFISAEDASADNERAVPTPTIRSKRKSTAPVKDAQAVAVFTEEERRDKTAAAQIKRAREF